MITTRRILTIICIVFLIAASICCADGEVQTWQDSLIFHLPFDDSFTPVHSGGDSSPKINGEPTFTEGKKGRAAIFADNANLIFDAESNFDQSEGTLAMWVQPYWIENDGSPHCFFEVPVGPEMFLDGGFTITKGWSDKIKPDGYYFYNSPGHRNSMQGLGLEVGEWTHVAFTWSSSAGTMSIYRNGELIGLNRGLNLQGRPPSKGRPMIIGARLGGKYDIKEKKDAYFGRLLRDLPANGAYGADAAIDELMIFNRILTDTEISTLADRKSGSLKTAKIKERRDGSYLHDVELQLKTPHIKFSYPAVRPVKALFITPVFVAPRDIVELSQRCEINFKAVTTARHNRLTGFPEAADALQWEGTAPHEKLKELFDKLAENPEVIVIANFEFDKLPGQIQSQIHAQVNAGAGLVVTFPRKLHSNFTQTPNPAGINQIIEGIPLAGMPECFPGKKMTPDVLAENVVRTFSYGKGRVAVINWDTNLPSRAECVEGLAPSAVDGRWTRQYEHRYNYYLSLVGKAIQWAAGQKPKATWTQLPKDGQILQKSNWPKAGFAVNVAWAGEEKQPAVLKAVIRDDRGRIEANEELTINLQPGENTFTVPLSQLKCGKHYLDLTILASGKIQNWATVYFEVQGAEQIVSLTTSSDYYERDETVKGKVRFRSAVPFAAELAIRAVDTNGRVYNRSSVPIKVGTSEAEFKITVDRTTTLASYIEADVIRDGKVLSCGEKVIFVPKRDPKEFLNVLWCTILNEGIGQVALRNLRKAGFNAVYHWDTSGLNFHNDAMADMMPVQYCTRIVLDPDHRGWATGSFGQEDGSFANPKVKENLRELAVKSVNASGLLGPPYYSLGNENVIHWGLGYSPYGLKYFCDFLEKRYGTIAKLNKVYNSDYADFKDVPRYKISEAMAKSHIPAVIDHRLATDYEWADYYRFAAQEFKKIDPYACVGAEGSEPGDLEQTIAGVGIWGAYHDLRGDTLQRSLRRPEIFSSHWWASAYGDGAKDCTQLWDGLICGFMNFQQFFNALGIEGSLNRDFSYRAFLPKILPELQEIYAGPALLLKNAEVVSDDLVAIHYSRLSTHASLILKNLATTGGLDNTLLLAFKELGQDHRYVSGNQIAAGNLLTPRAKVFFMPASYALSQAEADSIKEFVRQGGTVVADVLPGVLDEFGRRLSKGRLDDVFGVTCNGKTTPITAQDIDISVKINSIPLHFTVGRTSVDSALVVKNAESLAKTGEVPLLLTNKFGDGKAILLNFDASRGPKFLRTSFIKELLQIASVEPVYRLDGPPTTKISVLKRGDMTLVGVIFPEDSDDVPATVSWETPACAYNLRKGQYLGSVTKISIPPLAKAGRVHLFTLQKEPVKCIDLAGTDELIRGKSLKLNVQINVGKVDPKDRLIRIDVTDPNGETLQHYRDFITLDGSSGKSIIPFAFNDTPGTWTIRATDVATAISTEKKVVLK